MEEFYYEESGTKNIFLKILIFLFCIGLCVGGFLYYKKNNIIKLKNIKVELGTELSKNVDDYLINGKNFSHKYKLYLDNVDINTVGKYTYKIKYNKHVKSGHINVVDTTAPLVTVDDNVTVGTNEEFNPNFLITSCIDKSLPCTATLKNENDYEKLKKSGTYNMILVISDTMGNKTEKNIKITASDTQNLSSKVTNDLNYYTNSENDDKIEHILFEKLDKAIDEDTLEYEGLIQETSAIDFDSLTDKEIYSTKLITAYNKYGYVIGIQVLVTYNDGTSELLEK